MKQNPILEELYAIREKLLEGAGGDVKKYLRGVREREAASGRLLPPAGQHCNHQETGGQPMRTASG